MFPFTQIIQFVTPNHQSIAQRELEHTRIKSLEAIKSSIYHDAEAKAQKIYNEAHCKYADAIVKQMQTVVDNSINSN